MEALQLREHRNSLTPYDNLTIIHHHQGSQSSPQNIGTNTKRRDITAESVANAVLNCTNAVTCNSLAGAAGLLRKKTHAIFEFHDVVYLRLPYKHQYCYEWHARNAN